jgi:polysaccharide export outer membrane protein
MMKHAVIILFFIGIYFTGMYARAAEGEDNTLPSAITEEDIPETSTDWPPGTGYTIGPGDVIYISVWKNEELTKLLTVLPDGKISFPLIGELMAEGKTVAELKKEVEERLSPRFILNPVLTVEVRQVNSMLIYVIGKVNHPGRFALNSNINVLQALSMAGGLNPFAKRNSIKIFRETGGKTAVFEFRYDDVSDGINLEQNIPLKKGDVIVVP